MLGATEVASYSVDKLMKRVMAKIEVDKLFSDEFL